TTDGFRWQEVFQGADSVLLSDPSYTPDTQTMKHMYWSPDAETRRSRLFPFLWNVVAAEGQLYGNRKYGNKVNVANPYAISYPGYSELFTGSADWTLFSNARRENPHRNLLEYLNRRPDFRGRVAAFTSWDVFPYILNERRSGLVLNSGYDSLPASDSSTWERAFNRVQDSTLREYAHTRPDRLTFEAALDYAKKYHPRVLYLGLGQTDEYAHSGRYDLYLQQAGAVDQMLAELWHFVQTTEGYRNRTTFVITTDHGRGTRPAQWSSHHGLVEGASQTWMALLGPSIPAAGEQRQPGQVYTRQLAQTMAEILGTHFSHSSPVAGVMPGGRKQ
ncbi:MAG TPA: hypothetical protein VG870_14175, partial [Chitinophagaceae bacterium]|nr:hypothetical protein [Chitinophagaceae bacterium]